MTTNHFSSKDLVAKYRPLVRHIALNLVSRLPASVELEDFCQAGTMGLLDAASRYDPSTGADLATYAAKRIRGAMFDLLRDLDPVPRGKRRVQRALIDATEKVNQRLGRKASSGDIAEEMDIPLERLHNFQALVSRFVVTALPEHDSGTAVWDPTVAELARTEHDGPDALYGDDDPLVALADKQLLQHIYQSSAKLTPRQREALGHYLAAKTLGATAEAMNVSQSRVCQIRIELVRKLREVLREDHGYDVPSPEDPVIIKTDRGPRRA
ncbi:sigma-70 family RNA polymerase sigma factor [Paraburkholderia youngii]|uniref:sigma-70 family RNA polymerase sigma factor n=1 Tax=Paraburkholderia youngii TaxID=2782701 RepID=UPI003D232A12